LRDTSISRATRSQSIAGRAFFVAAVRFGAALFFAAPFVEAPFFAVGRLAVPLSFVALRFATLPFVAVGEDFRAGVRDISLFLAVVLFAMIRGYSWDKRYVD
jgi:hypothetical protein